MENSITNASDITENNTETLIQNSGKPYSAGEIWFVSILFGPIAAGIIGYKSMKELKMPASAKIILKASIIFSIIAIIVGFTGIKGASGVVAFMSLTFSGLICKTQSKALARWESENPNGVYGSITSSILYGILGGLIYITPFIIFYGYQYLHPCPSGYIVMGDYCYPLTNLKNLKNK